MSKIKILLLFFLLSAIACKQKTTPTATHPNKVYYTCSMHPQVHLDHDGNCPICGMKLIKVELTDAANSSASDKISLTATQIQLAAIQTDTVRAENVGTIKTLTGTVTTDETATQLMSARIAGRIQQLFVKVVGEKIAIGQPLYTIYSEDLQEAEKEYLLALQQQKVLHNPDVDYRQLIGAAESKLALWGLSAAQIRNIAASGKVSATTTVLSKISGTVSTLSVTEGDYVTEGAMILKTQSLNSLWVEAQIYANETTNYKEHDMVNVALPDLGGQMIKGRVEFINPELSQDSKVDLLRINIPNPQGLIRPGMLAYITTANSKQLAVAVPASAILTDGRGSTVWVKNTDGSFSKRMIESGPGNQFYSPVISGLNAGDIVVTNGAYLLNSEAIFKNGNDIGMAGMKM